MGAQGTPLGIGLAIDFANLDKDLSKVADRIENVGKDVSLRVGSLAGMVSKGDLKGDELKAQVANVGIQLSQGMASGIRTSSAMMLGFGTRINSMLDRLAGTAITMFDRIDNAMKFPKIDAALSNLHVSLKNVWTGGKKNMSGLDRALGGGFGKIAQMAARILDDLFKGLGDKIANSIKESMSGVIPSTTEMAGRMVESMDAAARSISRSMTEAIDKIMKKMNALAVAPKSMKKAWDPFLSAGMASKGDKVTTRAKPATYNVTETRLAKSVGSLSPSQRAELMEKPLPKQDFKAAMPKPEFGKVLKEIWAGVAKGVGVATERAKMFGKYVAGSQVVGGLMLTARGVALIGDAALVTVRFFYRLHNTISSLGNIHKQTFHKMFEDHGLFVGTLLGVVKIVSHLFRGLFDLVTLRAFHRVADDAREVKTSVGVATGAVKSMIGSVVRLGVEIGAAFGVIGIVYKVVEFFRKGTAAASELNATTEKTKTVFGAAFGPVEAQAKKLESTYSIMEKDQLNAAAGFGNLAINAGMSQKAAAQFSNEMIVLSANLATAEQTEGGFSEAASNIQAALAGSTRSLREEAGQISAASITQRALSDGMDRSSTAATNQATLMSRARTIGERLWFTQDALARSANVASVQFKKAGGGVAIFAEKMGELILPMAGAATSGFNTLLGSVLDFVSFASPAIKSWAAEGSDLINQFVANIKTFGPSVVANITWAWEEAKKGPFSFVIQGIEWLVNFSKGVIKIFTYMIRYPGIMWEIATLKVGEFVENAMRWIGTMPENFGRIFQWLGKNWANLLVDMLNFFSKISKNIALNAWNLSKAIWNAFQGNEWQFTWTPLLEGFKATTEKLPELIKPDLISVADAVKEKWDKIGALEVARPKFKAPESAGAGITPPGVREESKGYKLGSALEVGSKEAFSALSRGSNKGSQVGVAKESLTVQKQILQTNKEHLAATKQTAEEFMKSTKIEAR